MKGARLKALESIRLCTWLVPSYREMLDLARERKHKSFADLQETDT